MRTRDQSLASHCAYKATPNFQSSERLPRRKRYGEDDQIVIRLESWQNKFKSIPYPYRDLSFCFLRSLWSLSFYQSPSNLIFGFSFFARSNFGPFCWLSSADGKAARRRVSRHHLTLRNFKTNFRNLLLFAGIVEGCGWSVWPEKNCQMSIKVAQKLFH